MHMVRWENFKVLDIAVFLESGFCNPCASPFPEVQRTFRKCVWSVSLIRTPQKVEKEQSNIYQHQLTCTNIVVKHKIVQVFKMRTKQKYDMRTGAYKPCACGWNAQE